MAATSRTYEFSSDNTAVVIDISHNPYKSLVWTARNTSTADITYQFLGESNPIASAWYGTSKVSAIGEDETFAFLEDNSGSFVRLNGTTGFVTVIDEILPKVYTYKDDPLSHSAPANTPAIAITAGDSVTLSLADFGISYDFAVDDGTVKPPLGVAIVTAVSGVNLKAFGNQITFSVDSGTAAMAAASNSLSVTSVTGRSANQAITIEIAA